MSFFRRGLEQTFMVGSCGEPSHMRRAASRLLETDVVGDRDTLGAHFVSGH
jgi:hypothetical protein